MIDLTMLRFLLFVLLFDALALVVLYPRIDWFSGAYLVFSTFLAMFQAVVYRRFSKSPEICSVFYAQHLDKLWDRVVPVLGLLELVVFYDYAHKLIPFRLVRIPVQSIGLLLLCLACVWLVWVDIYFLRNFEAHYRAGTFLADGPFRYVHHPRYAGLTLTRLATILIFGNVFVVILAALWFWLIRRRIRLEEVWLATKFGSSYSAYLTNSRTPHASV